MKTISILSIIPRDTPFHKQSIDRVTIDQNNVTETYIDNITVSIDTTSLYNIRVTNTIGNVTIEPGFYKISKLADLLKDYLEIRDTGVKVLKDITVEHAPCLRKIFFHTNDTSLNTLLAGYTIDLAPDEMAGMSIIKIYSNIIKEHLVNTSMVDVPIYTSIGLDNTIMRNNVHIPVVLNSNQQTIEFYMTNLYDEVIQLSQPVYINMTINFEEQ